MKSRHQQPLQLPFSRKQAFPPCSYFALPGRQLLLLLLLLLLPLFPLLLLLLLLLLHAPLTCSSTSGYDTITRRSTYTGDSRPLFSLNSPNLTACNTPTHTAAVRTPLWFCLIMVVVVVWWWWW
jgi:hypothetical protein